MDVPPVLHAVYDDEHPFVVVRKPAQSGGTESNLLLAAWAADRNYAGRGVVLYVLPTAAMAEQVSQVRMAEIIRSSAYLRRRAQPTRGVAKSPARMQLRTIGPGRIHFCGADQEQQYSGIDADLVIADEYALMKVGVLPLLQARLRSSRAPRLRVTSTPINPDEDISLLYDASDMRYYEMQCPACGNWQEPHFPESVDWQRMMVVCLKCTAQLDAVRPGRWIARQPKQTEIRGYQINPLTLPDPRLEDMRRAIMGPLQPDLATFSRLHLGIPYEPPESRLTVAEVMRCADPASPSIRSYDKIVLGVDVGARIDCVIRGRFEGRWYLIRAFTVRSFEELDPQFQQYRINTCVVDGQYDPRAVSVFQARHRGRVWRARYVGGGEIEWRKESGEVIVPRTSFCDETSALFRERANLLPWDLGSLPTDYIAHLVAPARRTRLGPFGEPVVRYDSAGRRDDFFHAEVFATVATKRILSKVAVHSFNLSEGPPRRTGTIIFR